MKKVDRRFTKPTQISKHLYCPICIEVYLDATRLFCGHTFCKECISKWANEHHNCPVCRETIEINLVSKDLIAEKIIQDLEVSCINKLCDWRDRLEVLPKHINACSFGNMPEWLQKAQKFVPLEEQNTTNDIFLQDNEQYIQRINDEVPRKSFLERLYTKNLETQQLVDSVFNKKSSIDRARSSGIGTLNHYDSLLYTVDDSDEEKENMEDTCAHKNRSNIDESSKIQEEDMEEKSIIVEIEDTIQREPINNGELEQSLQQIENLNGRNDQDILVLREVNGIERKRVPKRRREDEPVGFEDKSVQFILKKNKITEDENQIAS